MSHDCNCDHDCSDEQVMGAHPESCCCARAYHARHKPPSCQVRYRVNFGNGQVHNVLGDTKRACFAYLAMLESGNWGVGGAYVEFQDPDTGEWFSCGRSS